MLRIEVPKLKEVLFVAALALKPLYIGRSGTVQISDLIYLLLFTVFFLQGNITFPGREEFNWIKIYLAIIIYQFIVNTIAYFVLSSNGYTDDRFLRFNLYYIFNFIVCLTVFQLFEEIGYKRLLLLYVTGSVLSLCICYFGVVLNYTGSGRERGFFNNPNQLGYYAIIMMTLFVIYCKKIKRLFRIAAIVLCLVINVMSLSKASLVGAGVLLIVYAVVSRDERGAKKTIMMIVFTILVSMVLYIIMFSDYGFLIDNYYIRTMRRRLLLMQYENDTALGAGRGYDRIKEIGGLIITGVGEGGYDRFIAASGKELHSMYASTLVSYGIIVFLGYVYLFSRALFSNKERVFSVLSFSGILLYGVSHNGMRNTLLWTLLAMLFLRPYDIS